MSLLIPEVSSLDHQIGKVNAKVILVMYGDFECAYCKLTYPIIWQLQKEMNNECLFVFRYFLLKKKHPFALEAAKACEAAGRQNAYWKMFDALFSTKDLLTTSLVLELAHEIDLDIDQFKEDLQLNTLADKIHLDCLSAIDSDVNGTPCFYINGKRYDGDRSFAPFLDALKKG